MNVENTFKSQGENVADDFIVILFILCQLNHCIACTSHRCYFMTLLLHILSLRSICIYLHPQLMYNPGTRLYQRSCDEFPFLLSPYLVLCAEAVHALELLLSAGHVRPIKWLHVRHALVICILARFHMRAHRQPSISLSRQLLRGTLRAFYSDGWIFISP